MRIRSKIAIAILFSIGAGAAFIFGTTHGKESDVTAFKCYKLSPRDFQDIMAEEKLQPSPGIQGDAESRVVELSLKNLPSQRYPLMRVRSSRIDAMVYQGPQVDHIPVQVGKQLRGEDGGDNLRFELLDPANHSICVSEQQRAFNVWQAGPQVRIEFLPEARMDETTGTPRRFLVDGQ